MAKILVAYYSRSGNTEKMAQIIASGINESKTSEAVVKKVENVSVDEIINYDGIIIGTPVYYGMPAAAIKKLIDDSVKFHGKLKGKIGGAFASSANIAGGNETAILDILHAMLIHGMIIQGEPFGDHYGPVSISEPDERAKNLCLQFGRMISELAKKIFP